jgi:protein phosphatase
MAVRTSFGFPLSVSVHTDVGRVRSNNEDSHGHAWLEDGSLFVIVADGMGGHEAGEVASGLAVQVVEEVMGRDTSSDPRERLYNGLLEANEAILEEGRASGTRGMGTTAITGVFKGSEVHVGLIGDSRMYHFRKGQLVWRTLDHTRVQMLIDQGEISEEEGRNHPEAGMLTRALGHARMADGRQLVPDVLAEPLHIEELDVVVLSSDGLHDLVEDWEIGKVVAGKLPDEAARELAELACERGGHDNITVAVVVAGERSEPFDPTYVPETFEEEDPADAEATCDPPEDEAPPVAPPLALHVETASPPPKEKSGRGMMLGMAALAAGGVIALATMVAIVAVVMLVTFAPDEVPEVEVPAEELPEPVGDAPEPAADPAEDP